MTENSVEFVVYGDYALFSDPITRIGGEKFTYQVPTYEAIKGVLQSVYWKPTFIWVIDKVRVMNSIEMETKGIRPIKYASDKNDLSYYTYLKNVCYQVKAHFVWNENRPELAVDQNEKKHSAIAKRMIDRGGRRDVFLGTRECQAYVEPCTFGEKAGAYDDIGLINFGNMYHGITYADEAYDEQTKGMMTVRFWDCKMEKGIITYLPPKDCIPRPVREMPMKYFGDERNNFTSADEIIKEAQINVVDE